MKSKLIFVIPKEGSKIIDPLTRKPIHADGEHVEKTVYWQRRIMVGDVVVGTPKITEEPKQEVKEEQQFEDVGGDQ